MFASGEIEAAFFEAWKPHRQSLGEDFELAIYEPAIVEAFSSYFDQIWRGLRKDRERVHWVLRFAKDVLDGRVSEVSSWETLEALRRTKIVFQEWGTSEVEALLDLIIEIFDSGFDKLLSEDTALRGTAITSPRTGELFGIDYRGDQF